MDPINDLSASIKAVRIKHTMRVLNAMHHCAEYMKINGIGSTTARCIFRALTFEFK